jgi:LPXTG-motif cell wall-anchored protein
VSQGPEAGHLDRAGNWLICEDCDRAYPIRDDIPVMLIEEGDRFRGVPRAELPEVPPPEAPAPAAAASPAPEGVGDEQALILALAGLLVGIGLVLFLILRAKKKRSE